MNTDIAVVGSLNHDLTIVAPRIPKHGETILGTHHYSDNGGKGANQAIAAARLGAETAMFGLVGDDAHGAALVEGLNQEGVDTSGVEVDTHKPTGLAVITVDDQAENTIVVSPGANSNLAPQHLATHGETITQAKVLLVQLEVPIAAIAKAVDLCEGIVCLNPAPAQQLTADLLSYVDVLIPNRSELASLVDAPQPTDVDQTLEAVSHLPTTGSIVVTLGAEGALVVEDGTATHLPPYSVTAQDPTGAGDAFCGALARELSRGRNLTEAAVWANAAGALAASQRGAQSSMPTIEEVEALLEA